MLASNVTLMLLLSGGLSFRQERYPYGLLYSAFSSPEGSIRVLLNRMIEAQIVAKITLNGSAQFSLTVAGVKQLKTILALDFVRWRWDGKWRILLAKNQVSIPRDFGFAMLYNNVYISAKSLQKYPLEWGYILETKQVIPLENKALASHLWSLRVLHDRYDRWLKNARAIKIAHTEALIFDYIDIIRDDPKLPKELLPSGWLFEEARAALVRLIKANFGSQIG